MRELKKYIYKIVCILGLSLILISGMGCKFPDNQMDWLSIGNYTLNTLKFGQTTSDEFRNLAPGCIPAKLDKNNLTFTVEPEDMYTYKRIRVGFRNDKLDWIEFTLNNAVKASEIIELYGKPRNINKSYSNKYDYFDYDFFNVATDKKHNLARNITIFSLPVVEKMNYDILSQIPNWKYLNSSGQVRVGYLLESDFNKLYPDFVPRKNDDSSEYILDRLPASYGYKSVILMFNNGLLNSISLFPRNLQLEKVFKVYGADYKIEKVNSRYDSYEFKNFILVVDRQSKKVLNIGIVSAE